MFFNSWIGYLLIKHRNISNGVWRSLAPQDLSNGTTATKQMKTKEYNELVQACLYMYPKIGTKKFYVGEGFELAAVFKLFYRAEEFHTNASKSETMLHLLTESCLK